MTPPQPLASPLGAPVAEPVYLTVSEFGELLRCKKWAIYRLVEADPSLPVLKLPGRMLFPRERVLAWLRDKEQGHHPIRSQIRQLKKSRASMPSTAPCADGCAEDGAR